jgi:UrcA family protein
MMRTITAIAAVAAVSVLGAAAQAQTLTVHTAGYDLKTQAGARAFYNHLSQAVSAACGGAATNMIASEEERFQACYKGTMKAAVEKTHAPLVTALAGQAQLQLVSR